MRKIVQTVYSRLVVDEDDNVKSGLKGLNATLLGA